MFTSEDGQHSGLASNGFGASQHSTRHAAFEWVEDVPVVRAPLIYAARPKFWMAYTRSLARHCCDAAVRPDVVQLLSLNEWSVPGLLLLRRLQVPLVFTQTMARQPSGPKWQRRLKDSFATFPLRLVDCVVVSSTVMRDAFLKRSGGHIRVEVIPNGVDLERFAPPRSGEEKNELRRGLGLDPASQLLVFVGYLNHRKGIDVLAEAWALLARNRPNVQLVLVSPGYERAKAKDPEFIRRITTVLDNSGARDRVAFVGPVKNVEDYFRIADVFVFPSRREGMPNVVPEAFASGLPTILTPFLGFPKEFGRPGEEYLLVERTPEALAASIEQLLDNTEKRRYVGQRAREWAERSLSLEVSLDRYAALYKELGQRGLSALDRT